MARKKHTPEGEIAGQAFTEWNAVVRNPGVRSTTVTASSFQWRMKLNVTLILPFLGAACRTSATSAA